MTKPDYGMMAALAVLAGFIWLQDLAWTVSAGDTLPILVGLPLFVWLNRPWEFRDGPWSLAKRPALLGAILFPLGTLLGSTLVLTASWTALLWSWVSARTVPRTGAWKLLVLPFLSFPWLATDFERVGWWLRLSGAAAAEQLLAWCQFEASRQGTLLSVAGFTVSVEPACSGVNGLQAMLIAGMAVAYVKLRQSRLFWLSLPLLAGAAWTANVLRIAISALGGVGFNDEAAAAHVARLHLATGWLALCAMFALCWVSFSLPQCLGRTTRHRARHSSGPRPWLEAVLLGYSAWRSGGLIENWWHSPFDHWGWVAFLLWLLPIAWSARRRGSGAHAGEAARLAWLGMGLGLSFLGDLGDLNLSHHLGLAAVLIGLASRRCGLFWAASFLGWLPASGWLASRVGVAPRLFAVLRVAIATAGASRALLRLSHPIPDRPAPADAIAHDLVADRLPS